MEANFENGDNDDRSKEYVPGFEEIHSVFSPVISNILNYTLSDQTVFGQTGFGQTGFGQAIEINPFNNPINTKSRVSLFTDVAFETVTTPDFTNFIIKSGNPLARDSVKRLMNGEKLQPRDIFSNDFMIGAGPSFDLGDAKFNITPLIDTKTVVGVSGFYQDRTMSLYSRISKHSSAVDIVQRIAKNDDVNIDFGVSVMVGEKNFWDAYPYVMCTLVPYKMLSSFIRIQNESIGADLLIGLIATSYERYHTPFFSPSYNRNAQIQQYNDVMPFFKFAQKYSNDIGDAKIGVRISANNQGLCTSVDGRQNIYGDVASLVFACHHNPTRFSNQFTSSLGVEFKQYIDLLNGDLKAGVYYTKHTFAGSCASIGINFST